MSHKHLGTAYCLWFFLGIFGAHRFYLHRHCSGFLYLFTGGLFAIGWIVDLFLIPGMVDDYNEQHYHHHHHTEEGYVVQYVPQPQVPYSSYGYQAPVGGYPAPVGGYQAPVGIPVALPPQPVMPIVYQPVVPGQMMQPNAPPLLY